MRFIQGMVIAKKSKNKQTNKEQKHLLIQNGNHFNQHIFANEK